MELARIVLLHVKLSVLITVFSLPMADGRISCVADGLLELWEQGPFSPVLYVLKTEKFFSFE